MTEPSTKVLVALINGHRAGEATEDDRGNLTLAYDNAWRAAPDATPLSLSMPLAKRAHGDAVVRAYIWGLLPDSEQVLARWARSYHVSARNPFALLRHVGEDCAGAFQFATPDRVDALLAGDGSVEWISEEEIAERMRILRRDPAAWHVASGGQFSLAGAQAKTALHFDTRTRQWGDPYGAAPTTHILKPAVTGLDDHDLNEHLCLETARHLGLRAARSHVHSFGDERVIVVERYDRLRRDDTTVRIHQEDMCQALGFSPSVKYQNEGGPTPEQIINLLRAEIQPATAAAEHTRRFVDALAFNWIIGGTDGHAKNYSVLLVGRQVRLAPMYDVASALPYDDMYEPKLTMAMRVGGEYGLTRINGRHWRRFASDNGIDPDATVARIDQLAVQVPAALAKAVAAPAVRALGSGLPAKLTERVTARTARCREALTRV